MPRPTRAPVSPAASAGPPAPPAGGVWCWNPVTGVLEPALPRPSPTAADVPSAAPPEE